MKKMFFLMGAILFLSSGVAYAPLVTVVDDSATSDSDTATGDTDVVDLSDVDTDQPTWSPSFENTSDDDEE